MKLFSFDETEQFFFSNGLAWYLCCVLALACSNQPHLGVTFFRSTSSKELMIPDGWLCYLAPEVIKNLRCPISDEDDVISTLNYSTKSDVYAFGYDLLFLKA